MKDRKIILVNHTIMSNEECFSANCIAFSYDISIPLSKKKQKPCVPQH